MLVCPQCQFENPNTNKFCQECGTSLTQNTCPECDSLVPFNSVQCQECGAIAGVIWWALLVGDHPLSEVSPSANTIAITEAPVEAASGDRAAIYLDHHQRYQLLEVLQAPEPVETNQQAAIERHVRVLDCQPLQMSLLEALAKQTSEDSAGSSSGPLLTTATEGEAASSEAHQGQSVQSMAVPSIAQPYLALGSKFHQALPVVHDAWQQEGQQILLLEDRSALPRLIDLWLDLDLALPALQLLHWLYEMTELWSALEAWQACRSLLEIDNLRVDEDQAVCLQRLYADPVEAPLTLQDLGQLWQTLFAQSQRTQIGAIYVLLADIEAGKLATITDVRSRIEEVAHELQANQPETEMMSDSESFELTDASAVDPAIAAPLSAATHAADLSASTATTHLESPLIEPPADDRDSDDLPTVVLPMQLFNLEDAGRTDIGRQRDHNEDYFGIETQATKLESPSGKTVHARNLYILCDGMGGHAGGEVASALAVDTLRRYFKEKWQSAPFSVEGTNTLPGPDVLIEAVQLANKAIYDVNQQNARSGSGRMGTTLVVVLIQDTEAAVAHVGDSRLYRYTRKRGLEQITIDHEVGQREIQRGVDPDIAYARPDAYQLTQALGPRDEHFIKPDIQYVELNEDTLLLLCSDGLTDNDLLETHWRTHVEPLLSSQANLEQGVCQLIELANQLNGHDNITAIAIRAKVRPNLDHLR
jgi:protein phosphatase